MIKSSAFSGSAISSRACLAKASIPAIGHPVRGTPPRSRNARQPYLSVRSTYTSTRACCRRKNSSAASIQIGYGPLSLAGFVRDMRWGSLMASSRVLRQAFISSAAHPPIELLTVDYAESIGLPAQNMPLWRGASRGRSHDESDIVFGGGKVAAAAEAQKKWARALASGRSAGTGGPFCLLSGRRRWALRCSPPSSTH
jgi:hypothetical protein